MLAACRVVLLHALHRCCQRCHDLDSNVRLCECFFAADGIACVFGFLLFL
jgi:hypothetical protein